MSEKYETYCGQFKAAEREQQMQEELAKRISENGGKELNYFLIPKSHSRFNGKQSSGEDHYLVPLVFGRLSQNVKKPKIGI